MGIKAHFRRSHIRLVILFFVSLPLFFLFNNCKNTDVNLGEASTKAASSTGANSSDGQTEDGDGSQTVGAGSSSDSNGHGYSGKLSFLNFDLVPKITDGVTEYLPDNKLTLYPEQTQAFYSSPSKNTAEVSVPYNEILSLSTFNPYYKNFERKMYFKEGFHLYQNVAINGAFDSYRTPIVAYCNSSPQDSIAAGIAGVDLLIGILLKPDQNVWRIFDAPMVSHVVIGSLQNPTAIEKEASFKNLVHFHEDGFAITAQDAAVKVFYFFDRIINPETEGKLWKLYGNVVYKNKTINLTCHTIWILESKPADEIGSDVITK